MVSSSMPQAPPGSAFNKFRNMFIAVKAPEDQRQDTGCDHDAEDHAGDGHRLLQGRQQNTAAQQGARSRQQQNEGQRWSRTGKKPSEQTS